MRVGVGIVGCGLMGHKRARALGALEGARVVACADVDEARSRTLAEAHGARDCGRDVRALLADEAASIVVVATTHDALAPIATLAAERGKHVLLEKPGARRAKELEALARAADRSGARVRVGFNHRCHPAIRKARALVDEGAVGELLYVRGRYGHGGRVGYADEWRLDPARAGGGELIDQGAHLIDLSRWFLGELTHVQGAAPNYFWPAPVEDNAFMLLRTDEGRTAFLHASWTEWKNLFSFEIFGRTGKLQVDGLGGSYGTERLAYYRMRPEMGPPETTIWEYPGADDSFAIEMAELVSDVQARRPPRPGVRDAQRVLEVVERLSGVGGVDGHAHHA
jgi:predicted dehydrogenase